MPIWAWAILAAVGLGLGYWLLIQTEGTYLGVRAVTLMYDWVARRYDRIKNLSYVNEMCFLGLPLGRAVQAVPEPLILDVASGTGRLALTMVRQGDFRGQVVCIERSPRMLAEARVALADYPEQAACLRQDAQALGFADASFDAVTCLEALEFMTHPRRAVQEMVRVLKPGGVLMLSNRIGFDAAFFPGRLCGRGRLERYLHSLGLPTRSERWQVHYDLVWARKGPETEGDRPAAGPV